MLFALANPRLALLLTELIRGKSLTAFSKLPSEDALSTRMSSKFLVWRKTEVKQSTNNDPPFRFTMIIEYKKSVIRCVLTKCVEALRPNLGLGLSHENADSIEWKVIWENSWIIWMDLHRLDQIHSQKEVRIPRANLSMRDLRQVIQVGPRAGPRSI
jgi:hypothetical protein